MSSSSWVTFTLESFISFVGSIKENGCLKGFLGLDESSEEDAYEEDYVLKKENQIMKVRQEHQM